MMRNAWVHQSIHVLKQMHSRDITISIVLLWFSIVHSVLQVVSGTESKILTQKAHNTDEFVVKKIVVIQCIIYSSLVREGQTGLLEVLSYF